MTRPPRRAERFPVVLSNPVNATLGGGTGVVLIGENDATRVAQPRVSVGPMWWWVRVRGLWICR